MTLAAALIGSALGLMSGYFPRLDTPIMRTLDGLMAFPSILLAIAIMASLGTVGGSMSSSPWSSSTPRPSLAWCARQRW